MLKFWLIIKSIAKALKSIRIENITFDQIRDNAFHVNLRKTDET